MAAPWSLPAEAPPPASPTSIELPAVAAAGPLFGVHASLGFPQPFSVGLDFVDPSRRYSASLSHGFGGIGVFGLGLRASNTEVALRWHPFQGAFFVGAGIGTRSISVGKSEGILAASVEVKAEV